MERAPDLSQENSGASFIDWKEQQMAFHFERNEDAAEGIHRLLTERTENAAKRFAGTNDSLEAVHSVRKDIKKIRAILSVVRPHLPKKEFRKEARSLREIAALLTHVRDAQALLGTMEDLAFHFELPEDDPSFFALRAFMLKEAVSAEEQFFAADTPRQVTSLLKNFKEKLRLELGSSDDEWALLRSGISRTYANGRRKLNALSRSSPSEEFHEWRKSVKQLWYQMRLITPAWPPLLNALNDELRTLGETLGKEHDLAVLKTVLEGHPFSTKHRVYLLGLIATRQRQLRKGTLGLGQKIYAEKPQQFCKRLGCYWNAWRRLKSF